MIVKRKTIETMNINYILIAGLFFCTMIFFSCKDAAEYHDVLFISGTEESTSRMFTVDVAPSEIAFSVTAPDRVGELIEITVKENLNLVESYNKEFHKNYEALPAGSFELSSNTTTIQSGEFVSQQVKVSVIDLSGFEEGVTYLLPISITDVKGGIDVLEASRTIYFIVNRTIITQAASLSGNYFAVDFAKNNDASLKSLPAVTYETRIYVNKFAGSNPYISSVMGLEENFLMRFGDTSIKPNQLQIAKPGIASSTEFSTEVWYHIAAVFEGGTVKMYVNGKLESSGSIAGKDVLDLTYVYGDPSFMIGRSAKGRGINGVISECRVWTKALSQADLINNMCFIDPTTPGLLAYWRFNGSDGKTVTDLTGHGYDAIAGSTIKWVEGVRCPE